MRQGGFCKVFDDPGCLWSLRCNRKSGMEAAYLRGVSFTPFWAEAAIRLSRVTVGVTRRARTINVLKQHV